MFFVRSLEIEDLPLLEEVITSTGLFPAPLLKGMVQDYITNSDTPDLWFTLQAANEIIGLAYVAPERLTQGTYNLYLIAVHATWQGKGGGRFLLQAIISRLLLTDARILLVETSGLPDFELTRQFYLQNAFRKEAVITDFYQQGEDKVVFWKQLSGQ